MRMILQIYTNAVTQLSEPSLCFEQLATRQNLN